MDEREAQVVVGILAAYYPHQTMPDSTVAAWVHQLRAYSFEEAREAVEQLAPVEKWMPSLADIIAMIRAGWANRQGNMLGEPEGPTLQEFMESNPEWRERVEAFTKQAKGRREERSELPVDRYEKLRADAATLDRPTSTRPRKKSECKEHRFITHDRCFDCGAPAPTVVMSGTITPEMLQDAVETLGEDTSA